VRRVFVHRPGGQPPLKIDADRGRPIRGPAGVEAVADRVRRRQRLAMAGGQDQPGHLGDRGRIVAGEAEQGPRIVPGGEGLAVAAVAAAAQLPPLPGRVGW
jgi:hypothetical protein